MGQMIYFEFKKIFDRKFNIVAMAAGYILILFCVFSFIQQESVYDEETGGYMKGIQAFRLSENKNHAMADYLTEDYLTKLTEDIQAKNIPLDTDEGYARVVRPMVDMLWLLCDNYMDGNETAVDWNRVNEIPVNDGIHFYRRRIEKVRSYLDMDFSYGNYSGEEKEFWLGMEREVGTPFRWGSKAAMDRVWDTVQITFYLIFVIAVCISPVFAAEYESGAAALLFTTKNGKRRMVDAKIIASVLFGILYIAVGIGLGTAVFAITVGIHGAQLPVQLWGTAIPYNWSVGKACVVSAAVMLLIGLVMVMVTVLLSARLKASMAVLVIDFVILVGPALLPMSQDSRLWNQINYLFPVRVMAVKDMLRIFNSYQFGTAVLSYLGMAIVVYLSIAVICFFGVKRGFANTSDIE